MSKNKLLRGVCLVAATSLLPLSQAAMADSGGDNWSISGWINEGMTYFDDGAGSDIVQTSDNGTTLGSRITLSGSTDLPNSGLNAGFEVILEPQSVDTPLIFANQNSGLTSGAAFGDTNGAAIGVLGTSVNVGGAFGKVTVGLQSMPTDNIAVLADPSLTLWSGISPIFRGNGFSVRGLGAGAVSGAGGAVGAVWGDFLGCYGSNALSGAGGIGMDCNGIYRNGIRYDLPSFVDNLSIAAGYANDDIYDIAGKWNSQLGRMNAILHLGYSYNASGGATVGATDGSDTFQLQGGLMDPVTGLFTTIAYQNESADGLSAATQAAALAAGGSVQDGTDAYYFKVGVKKGFNSLGDTAIYFDYGSYNDQYSATSALAGVSGSEVQRIGVSVDQYFGSRLILYGKWENLELDVDSASAVAAAAYGGAQDLDTFTAGLVFFF